MLTTKFDLYKSEWLDLVFSNRNKNYGAYELRQHYSTNMLKAMGITFGAIAVSIIAYSLTVKHAVDNKPVYKETVVELRDVIHPIEPPKEIEPPKPVEAVTPPAAAKAPDVKTAVIPTKLTSEPTDVDPPKAIDIATSAIGTTKSEGEDSPGNVSPGTPDGTDKGSGIVPSVDNGVHENFEPMERLPQPVGGQQAWTKFLQRNLRFPSEAQEQGVNGKVFISFIIEKDGTLSDITVIRGGEHGFGGEALRVLKKAAAWTPGIQNGRPVRVKYVIPINFQLPE